MASITVRDVPDSARDELASRAARSGRSLQEFLRLELIALAGRPDPAVLAERIIERKSRARTEMDAATILGHLDSGRR